MHVIFFRSRWASPSSWCNLVLSFIGWLLYKVFLGFAKFYWRFIWDFSRIAAPFTSMLKTDMPLERPTSDRLVVGDNKGSYGVDVIKIVKKSRKLKGQKLSKSQKPAKSGKNLSKSGNSPNFDVKDSGPSFLIFEARAAFNHLRPAFIKALILWHFDPKYHIWIKTDALGYAIRGVLI